MAKNLKKFVNPKFLRTCDLILMSELMARHLGAGSAFDITTLQRDDQAARDALATYFAGPEDGYPTGLTTDLHHIADLGTRYGKVLLLQRAERAVVDVAPLLRDDRMAEPKTLAMYFFLRHRPVFDSASDLLAIERTKLTELLGHSRDVAPSLEEAAKQAFREAAAELFRKHLQGAYCRAGWYEDGDEVNLVVVHGMEVTNEWVVKDGDEKVITFQPLGTAVLSYNSAEGRLKIGGLDKAQREGFATLFATHILKQPDFFNDEDATDLYTLDPIEQVGFGFKFEHRFDPGIRSVRVVEVQVDRTATSSKPAAKPPKLWSVLVKDNRDALGRMGEVTNSVTFGRDAYRLEHIAFRVEFESERRPYPTVTVSVRPRDKADFKREFYEERIMELLRRNGLCIERKPQPTAVAA